MARARALGIPVSLDLSLRLENWGWDDGFRRVIEHAIDLADVVMGAGYDEIRPLTTSGDPMDAARELANHGRLVVARLGADGSLAASAEGVVSTQGFKIDLVDTVGAGDAHNAGFIFARLRGSNVEDALRWGNAVAALTVSQAGARSTPSLAEVEAFLAAKATG
jgi:sugar/nucleoside kinase (ribokinase family)